MAVREPKAMILCILTFWMCTVFEAIGHLAKDLELAKINWDKFMDREKVSVSSIFDFLSMAGYVFSGTIFLYRIWMFWYRSELNEVAPICSEAAAKGGQEYQSICVRMLNSLRTRKKVMVVCFIWAFILIFPVLLIDFILPTDQKRLQKLLIAIIGVGAIPMSLLMVVLVRSVKNYYGVVEEYKMVLAWVICTIGIRFSLHFTAFAESYYRFLIDFECRAGLTLAYFIYVMYVVRSYDVQRKSVGAMGLCGKLLNCCKGSPSPDITETKTWKDFTLSQLLSNRLGYNLFLTHVQKTLCVENLLCFVDIYRHRKSLNHDPFIELTEGENKVIYANLARIRMDWIDMEMRSKPSVVLTCKQIYRLYIEQSSKMEINIPGSTRKQLANVFGQSKPRKSIRQRLSVVGKLLGDKGISVQMTSRTSINFNHPGTECMVDSFSLSINSPTFNQKTVRSTMRSTIGSAFGDNLSVDDHHLFSTQRSTVYTETQHSIEKLYPVWKAVINLLNSDSLVRFNMAVNSNSNGRKSELDQITHPT